MKCIEWLLWLALQRPSGLVCIDNNAGGQRFRADEFEGAWRGSLGKDALARAQQDRIDNQQDLIRKPMFQKRRCQRGATREDKVRSVLRLDAPNALDQVGSKALEGAPCKTLRAVGGDIFCCRIEAVSQRTARRLWPEARLGIVGATAKQQIIARAVGGDDCVAAGGGSDRARSSRCRGNCRHRRSAGSLRPERCVP
jgi:hypothetical protein